MSGINALTVRVYDDYDLTTLIADLSGRATAFTFSTRLHGGFGEASLTIPMPMSEIFPALRVGNNRGWHFYHMEIRDAQKLVWEGRVMNLALGWDESATWLEIEAAGYYSSLRDQIYDTDESPMGGGAPGTDWSTGGPHTRDDIIKEMLTDGCPDISSDQSHIDANTLDIVGIDLADGDYPQNIIVDKLAPLADTDELPWYFAVWDDRIPYWAARSLDQVDYYCWLRDTQRGKVSQPGMHVRNKTMTAASIGAGFSFVQSDDADSQVLYPDRHIIIDTPSGASAGTRTAARDAALEEKAAPKLDSSITVKGQLYSTDAGFGAASGALVAVPKWRVRAGQVLRLQDLLPTSQATPELDALRTYYLLETRYDAMTDVLEIQPDRPGARLAAILARATNLERNR